MRVCARACVHVQNLIYYSTNYPINSILFKYLTLFSSNKKKVAVLENNYINLLMQYYVIFKNASIFLRGIYYSSNSLFIVNLFNFLLVIKFNRLNFKNKNNNENIII